MSLLEHINRIKELNCLINLEHTGSPQDLARHFHLCLRQLHYTLDELKDMGAKIGYDRIHQTYYYEKPFHLEIIIKVSSLDNYEQKSIFGGEKDNTMQFYCTEAFYLCSSKEKPVQFTEINKLLYNF